MEQKIIFRQLLHEILEIAEAHGYVLTLSEVDGFFAHAGLTPDQMELIYQYLEEQKVKITGRTPAAAPAGEAAADSAGAGDGEEASEDGEAADYAGAQDGAGEEAGEAAPGEAGAQDGESAAEEEGAEDEKGLPGSLSLYLEEIRARGLARETDEGEELALFTRAAAGDQQAAGVLAQRYLAEVIEMAAQYDAADALPEDLVGEGNLALMTALAELTPQESLAAYRRIVLSAVGAAMEAAAGEQRELEAKGQGLVKKVAGLDRAARELEKDLGRKVSAEELSAYLEMPLDEIRDILRMAGDQLGLEQDE